MNLNLNDQLFVIIINNLNHNHLMIQLYDKKNSLHVIITNNIFFYTYRYISYE